jgi:acetyltransferase-like isoleucine patch superfamily enzyme
MIAVTADMVAALKAAGVECHLQGGTIPLNTTLEPPCSIKWMSAFHSLFIGAFSYAVSGFYFHVSIGRYTSIGEQVQIGRGDHSTSWLSTSPVFYLPEHLFDVGHGFAGAADFHAFRPSLPAGAQPSVLKQTMIGNDVYIGHGAYIRAGVTIGDGAIVGAHAVVVKDVPPYAVVAGNPATIKKFKVPLQLIGPLLELAWWRFAPWQLTEVDVTRPAVAVKALTRLVPTWQPYTPATISLRAQAEQPRE